PVALRLAREAFPALGEALESAATANAVRFRLAAPDGTFADAAFTLTLRKDDFLLEGELPAGNLLMLETIAR
ncbi:MAG: hypothetical protein J6Y80_04575, partial [Victivallales bacterium]|nr:hypothetical protein [Victivallales bacterium]